jgi:hypothetical protein
MLANALEPLEAAMGLGFALSLCATACLIDTRFANILGASFLNRQCDRTLGRGRRWSRARLDPAGPQGEELRETRPFRLNMTAMTAIIIPVEM